MSVQDVALGFAVFGLTALGLVAVAAATGWEESLAALRGLTGWMVASLLAFSLVNYGLRALRWHLFARRLSLGVSLAQSLRHYLAGLSMVVTPGRVGELLRLRWLWREIGAPVERTAPLVLADRAFDLAAVGLALAACVAAGAAGLTGGLTAAGLALGLALIVTRPGLMRWGITRAWRLIGRWPRIFVQARRAAAALRPLIQGRTLLLGLALGAVGWVAEGYAFHLLLTWLGADIGLATAIGIFLLAMVGGGVTGLPGGVGGAEAAMLGLLHLQSVPPEVALPATAVIRLATLWFAILIGLCALPLAERAAARGATGRGGDALERV